MKYHQVITKINKVINSCIIMSQLQMAEDYLGDVGNNTMEGDIDLCIFPNTRTDYHY